MGYQALYRRYRPTRFEDFVGQEAVIKTLRSQIMSGRIAHAYLFCGTRGTGKTSTAKVLARAVNCEHPENGDPLRRMSDMSGSFGRKQSGHSGNRRGEQQRRR